MLDAFLELNRSELTSRCRVKSAARAPKTALAATDPECGVPILIDQLVEMLRIEQPGDTSEPAKVEASMGRSAAKHGRDLLRQGFSVDQVVHDYGDLCQALTELAQEKQEPISVGEFHTFNRCLDRAIADAVTEFARRRDHVVSTSGSRSHNEQIGSLADELQNLVNTATLAVAAIKGGHGALMGATGGVLDRTLHGLRDLSDRARSYVHVTPDLGPRRD